MYAGIIARLKIELVGKTMDLVNQDRSSTPPSHAKEKMIAKCISSGCARTTGQN